MNIVELDTFLSTLEPVEENDDLAEAIGDLTANLTTTELQLSDTRAIVSHAYTYPELLSDCSVDLEADGTNQHIFRITPRGVDLNVEAFRWVGEESSVDGPEFESRISSHIAQEREGQLIDSLVDFLYEVENQTSYTIDFSLILDKNEISTVILSESSMDMVQSDNINPIFWYDLNNLATWLANHDFTSYSMRFFPPDKMPVLIHYLNLDSHIEGTTLLPVFQLTDDISITQSEYQDHQNRTSTTGENTTFQQGAPIITPALFAESSSLTELFLVPLVYSIFSVFSDRVTRLDDRFEFHSKYGPETLETTVNLQQFVSVLSPREVGELRSLYRDFADREERAVFVGFWRRSVVHQCSSFTEIPAAVDQIREHYQFIEAETVEGNFDELSDAVRDTHAFMTDITSQVADTTAALSTEIQRLVFTLLGAILANLFLILRWGNIDMVVPFSLFVVSAILVFYFPLIDRRIDELEEMKTKGERDYQTYNDIIRSFTGEAFDFSQIERRKEDYMGYAVDRLGWARRILRRIHVLLVMVGFVFVILATIRYPPASPQIALAGLFFATLGYLVIRVRITPDAHSYYKIAFPWRDRDQVEDIEEILHTNYLLLIAAITSLGLLILNIVTLHLPLMLQP